MSEIKSIKKSIRNMRDEFVSMDYTDLLNDIDTILRSNEIPSNVRDTLILLWSSRQKDLENIKKIQFITLIKVIDSLHDSVDTLADGLDRLELKCNKIEHIALDNKIGLPFKILGAVVAVAFLLFTLATINPEAVTHAINGTKDLVGIAFDNADKMSNPVNKVNSTTNLTTNKEEEGDVNAEELP